MLTGRGNGNVWRQIHTQLLVAPSGGRIYGKECSVWLLVWGMRLNKTWNVSDSYVRIRLNASFVGGSCLDYGSGWRDVRNRHIRKGMRNTSLLLNWTYAAFSVFAQRRWSLTQSPTSISQIWRWKWWRRLRDHWPCHRAESIFVLHTGPPSPVDVHICMNHFNCIVGTKWTPTFFFCSSTNEIYNHQPHCHLSYDAKTCQNYIYSLRRIFEWLNSSQIHGI